MKTKIDKKRMTEKLMALLWNKRHKIGTRVIVTGTDNGKYKAKTTGPAVVIGMIKGVSESFECWVEIEISVNKKKVVECAQLSRVRAEKIKKQEAKKNGKDN